MVTIIGIDGLDKNIIDRHIDSLPNFRKIGAEGVLCSVESVFPADSVPAWTTIFTGLNPAEHGIIRGKDYVESVDDFGSTHGFVLKGKTFWDHYSDRGLKCLVINPFLAYPAWRINGIMESGPAFIEGDHSIFPENADSLYPDVLGGYSAISSLAGLKAEMEKIFTDTDRLWKEFDYQLAKDQFDLAFVTFTTLDRLQHYTWRYYDRGDPLYEEDDYFSNCIPKLLKDFDDRIGSMIKRMSGEDIVILISDHGFSQRPFSLINLNEYLRKAGLLIFKKEYETASSRGIQILKTIVVSILSRLKLLDKIAAPLKRVKGIGKLKKSDFMIDKENSVCYTDDLFSGKKPYVGLKFGEKVKKADKPTKEAAFRQLVDTLNSGEIPKPVMIEKSEDFYHGEFQDRLPDVLVELPPENGIEFSFFGQVMEKSKTHFRISGGHFGSGTFGYFHKENKTDIQPPSTILGFSDFIKKLLYENSSGK